MLADRLEAAAPAIVARAGDGAAALLGELIAALRGGERPAPAVRGPLGGYLERLARLKASVAAELDGAPAREVWAVGEWFAAAAEVPLTAQNRQLSTMLDALPDHLILQDRDARVLFVNRAAAELATSVLERPRDELTGSSVLDGDQPDSFKQFALGLVERAGKGERFTEEFTLPTAQGGHWFETHVVPVAGDSGEVEAVAMASRDIHARKQAEALLRLLSKLGALVGMDTCSVMSGVAHAAIPELADAVILEPVEAGGRHEVAHLDAALAAAALTQLEAGARIAEVTVALGATSTLTLPIVVLGETVAVATFVFTEVSGRRHGDEERAIAGYVAARAEQIVENARLEGRLRASIDELTRAHGDLGEALAFRERVMGILGHDLRNPLAVVLSLSQILGGRAELPERMKEGLGHIRRSAERMEQMINTILDFTQLRFRGAPALAREAFELDSLARRIVDELQVAHPQRGLAVTARGDLRGRWDYTRLGQVISNLVGNALTHGARESPITVEVAGDGGDDSDVTLVVSNRGPTIPEAAQARLFEPFWQASTENKARGLGLGLFIVQQIVHAHGGAVVVRSLDEETSFTVRLPRAHSAPAAGPHGG